MLLHNACLGVWLDAELVAWAEVPSLPYAYVAFTAATGGLSQRHAILTYSISTPQHPDSNSS